MPIYQSTGQLTDYIEPGNVAAAQAYLAEDAMAQYLDAPLREVVERLEWRLNGNGHDYVVEAVTTRELTEKELEQLASEVSGQNSDGLGEGFEQQEFAETGACGACDACEYGDACEDAGMISFDWQTNDSHFTRV